jgi:predicted protein tyrosine phosphatase
MEIKVLSHLSLDSVTISESSRPKGTYAVIKIADSTSQPLHEILANIVSDDPNHKGTLYQQFDDIVEPYHEFELFSEIQARDIFEFVDELKKAEVEVLYVSCVAGISRSSAIASAIEHYLDNHARAVLYWNTPAFSPNVYVYSTLMKLLGKYKEEEVILLQKLSIQAMENWSMLNGDFF